MSTDRPMVTASVDQDAYAIHALNGDTLVETIGVHIELTFSLHDHEAALRALDAAVEDIRAQVSEVGA